MKLNPIRLLLLVIVFFMTSCGLFDLANRTVGNTVQRVGSVAQAAGY